MRARDITGAPRRLRQLDLQRRAWPPVVDGAFEPANRECGIAKRYRIIRNLRRDGGERFLVADQGGVFQQRVACVLQAAIVRCLGPPQMRAVGLFAEESPAVPKAPVRLASTLWWRMP